MTMTCGNRVSGAVLHRHFAANYVLSDEGMARGGESDAPGRVA